METDWVVEVLGGEHTHLSLNTRYHMGAERNHRLFTLYHLVPLVPTCPIPAAPPNTLSGSGSRCAPAQLVREAEGGVCAGSGRQDGMKGLGPGECTVLALPLQTWPQEESKLGKVEK